MTILVDTLMFIIHKLLMASFSNKVLNWDAWLMQREYDKCEYTVECHYNANVLLNLNIKHPIAHPFGRRMVFFSGFKLWFTFCIGLSTVRRIGSFTMQPHLWRYFQDIYCELIAHTMTNSKNHIEDIYWTFDLQHNFWGTVSGFTSVAQQ